MIWSKNIKMRSRAWVPEDEDKLPFIYSTAKQHKDPVAQRFIVSGKRCTTKQLSRTLLKVFRLVSKTLRTHCRYKCKFLNTKAYWIIDNAADIQYSQGYRENKHQA